MCIRDRRQLTATPRTTTHTTSPIELARVNYDALAATAPPRGCDGRERGRSRNEMWMLAATRDKAENTAANAEQSPRETWEHTPSAANHSFFRHVSPGEHANLM